MEKYATMGEILYIGFVCEKGRCTPNHIWKFNYGRVLKKHMQVMHQLLYSMMYGTIEDNNFTIKEAIKTIQQEPMLKKFYPFEANSISQDDKYLVMYIDTIEERTNYQSINKLMLSLIEELLQELKKTLFIDKSKIYMLIRVLHNLPKVYLGNKTSTLCNLKIIGITAKEAMEYACLNMDEDTKKRYQTYIDRYNNDEDLR